MTKPLTNTAGVSPSSAPPDATPPRGRIDLIDVLRGVAILAMIIFHGAWDLSQADLIATDISTHQGWQNFARTIAASFLTLVGISLVLGHGQSHGKPQGLGGFRRDAFLRRWALVAGAALLVSLGTWFAIPDAWIFFGILHNIALSSLLAIPFLALPWIVVATVAVLVLALPFLIRSPLFDPQWLIWTGLAERVPDTVDFVPLFPWFGCVLMGMALARLGQDWLERLNWQASNPPASWLKSAGQHSLAIYLIHQPVLIGSIWLMTKMLAIAPIAMAPGNASMVRFEAECVAVCRQSASPEFCTKGCACARTEAEKDAGLAEAIRIDKIDARWQARLGEISKGCLK
ncbi:MAG: heparan-alpha-glucosaminide N-acetyltransferase [Bosea sp. (in: a-proteobacteria)]